MNKLDGAFEDILVNIIVTIANFFNSVAAMGSYKYWQKCLVSTSKLAINIDGNIYI